MAARRRTVSLSPFDIRLETTSMGGNICALNDKRLVVACYTQLSPTCGRHEQGVSTVAQFTNGETCAGFDGGGLLLPPF